MNFEKKINNNNEIDLIEISIIIWKHKLKVFLFVAFALVAMLFFITNQNSNKPYYIAKTEIRPISTFKEFEYESYNSYLNYTNKENVYYSLNLFKEDKEELKKNNFVLKDVNFNDIVDNSSFKKFDREYLLNLFIDKLNENSFFLSLIKKFDLIKRDDYESERDFENSAIKLASSIKVSLKTKNDKSQKDTDLQSYEIIFKTTNKEFWKKTLSLIEENANLEIQNYLIESFNKLISHQKKLMQYRIEDINIFMTGSKDKYSEKSIVSLEKLKSDMMQNKNIERLQDEFSLTPVMSSSDFQAANIMIKSTSFKTNSNKKYKTIPMLIIAGIISLVVGIFFVTILETFKNRYKG